MPIDNQPLKLFCDQTLRPVADMLAGLIPAATSIVNAVVGKGLSSVLGTDDATLLRELTWDLPDYGATGANDEVVGSDSDGRTLLRKYDILALIRVLVKLKNDCDANPQLGTLIAKFAVNPRPDRFAGV